MVERRDGRGAMPAVAIVLVALAIAAVIGLIAGAIWGQTGSRGPSSSSSTSTTAASPSTATSDTASPGATATDTPTPAPPTSPASSPTGAAPSAPATTTTSADGWRLGSWRITNTGGTLGVDTTARNTSTGPRSATLVLYVYVNGTLIATTTTAVTDVPAGASVPVHFSGTDPWKPGPKVLQLATA